MLSNGPLQTSFFTDTCLPAVRTKVSGTHLLCFISGMLR